MANKKSKGSKGKGGKSQQSKGQNKRALGNQNENTKDSAQMLQPQDRVNAVRPFWESVLQQERVEILTIDYEALKEKALEQTDAARHQAVIEAVGNHIDPTTLAFDEPTYEEILEEGFKRLKERETWKVWSWPPDNVTFLEAEQFRQHILEKHIKEDLKKLLPHDDGKGPERPAETAFRQRMTDLLQKVQQSNRQLQEDSLGRFYRRGHRIAPEQVGFAVRESNIELITMMMEALEKEHEFLYNSVLIPITTYVMECLPNDVRETSRLELYYEDLEKCTPEEVARINEWLTEKVDALSSRLKPEPKDLEEEEEEDNMGDVDLWTLTANQQSLTINPKWLSHLQDRLLGEDGHPRKVKSGEDPHKNGLVLEWIYGSIVSTAEKARDGAKRTLGSTPPCPRDAHNTLVRALEDQSQWENRARQARELLAEMMRSRKDVGDAGKQQAAAGGSGTDQTSVGSEQQDPLSSTLGNNLPDETIVLLLRRETLLTRAKLQYLVYQHIMGEKELRSLKAQLRQGSPEYDRLKREVEEVKASPRGLDGTYRSAAEMERHRHALADAAIEEQLEVQTAFREQGARLQGIYERRQRCETEMSKRENEIKSLQGWKSQVEALIEKFEKLLQHKTPVSKEAKDAASASTADVETGNAAEPGYEQLTSAQMLQLQKLRAHFYNDLRKQLYSNEDDRAFFKTIQDELKAIEKRLEDGRVLLQHLELALVNVACDDPGAAIGTQLALPIVQDRLDSRALQFAAERAKAAESEIVRMEAQRAEMEAAEREKRALAAKVKKAEKVTGKVEKERGVKANTKREVLDQVKREEERKKREEEEEAKRAERLALLEDLRRAEEEAMEKRRQELLAEENGYWRQRYLAEERAQAEDASMQDGMDDSSEEGDGFVVEVRRRRNVHPAANEKPAVNAVIRGVIKSKAGGGEMVVKEGSVEDKSTPPASKQGKGSNSKPTQANVAQGKTGRPKSGSIHLGNGTADMRTGKQNEKVAAVKVTEAKKAAPSTAVNAKPKAAQQPATVVAASLPVAATSTSTPVAAPAQSTTGAVPAAAPSPQPSREPVAPQPVKSKDMPPGAGPPVAPMQARTPSAVPQFREGMQAIHFGTAAVVPLTPPPSPAANVVQKSPMAYSKVNQAKAAQTPSQPTAVSTDSKPESAASAPGAQAGVLEQAPVTTSPHISTLASAKRTSRQPVMKSDVVNQVPLNRVPVTPPSPVQAQAQVLPPAPAAHLNSAGKEQAAGSHQGQNRTQANHGLEADTTTSNRPVVPDSVPAKTRAAPQQPTLRGPPSPPTSASPPSTPPQSASPRANSAQAPTPPRLPSPRPQAHHPQVPPPPPVSYEMQMGYTTGPVMTGAPVRPHIPSPPNDMARPPQPPYTHRSQPVTIVAPHMHMHVQAPLPRPQHTPQVVPPPLTMHVPQSAAPSNGPTPQTSPSGLRSQALAYSPMVAPPLQAQNGPMGISPVVPRMHIPGPQGQVGPNHMMIAPPAPPYQVPNHHMGINPHVPPHPGMFMFPQQVPPPYGGPLPPSGHIVHGGVGMPGMQRPMGLHLPTTQAPLPPPPPRSPNASNVTQPKLKSTTLSAGAKPFVPSAPKLPAPIVAVPLAVAPVQLGVMAPNVPHGPYNGYGRRSPKDTDSCSPHVDPAYMNAAPQLNGSRPERRPNKSGPNGKAGMKKPPAPQAPVANPTPPSTPSIADEAPPSKMQKDSDTQTSLKVIEQEA